MTTSEPRGWIPVQALQNISSRVKHIRSGTQAETKFQAGPYAILPRPEQTAPHAAGKTDWIFRKYGQVRPVLTRRR
jgi:hypothetical protein